ncbi:MAG: hypothetical protein NTX28_07645 [Novosphingobium sp.]|nr:hypothetical protein [Novosphingobium sp.]
MTIRLLSTYRQFKPNTNVTLASGTETALVAGGNATTDLSGGVPYDYQLPANTMQGNVAYAPDGVPLGIADSTGKIISGFSGIAAPGAPTGIALTAIAGGVLATLTAPGSNGGTAITGYEVTLSTGQVQLGETTTITVNAPAGVAVTATAKAINGFGKSVASTASASVTPTAFVTPARPGAPTSLTLAAGNGKVTATWAAAASNGSAIRDTIVTLSNGATGVALGSATTVDITTPNGLAVTATARANNGEGAGPVSGVSNSVTPVFAVLPGQPAKPVLTAMAGAVSLAWTPGAANGTTITGNVWTDINGNTTALTTNPQVITAPAGTPYTGTVKTQNSAGFGPPSAQADAVTPTASAPRLAITNWKSPNSTTQSIGSTRATQGRNVHVIGDPVRNMRMRLPTFSNGNGGDTLLSPDTGIYAVEIRGVAIPVLFNGVQSRALASDERDVLSDIIDLTPAGITNGIWPSGEEVFVRYEKVRSATTDNMGTSVTIADDTRQFCTWFNPDTVTAKNTINAAGPMTAITGPGGSVFTQGFGYAPMLVGEPVDPSTFIALGSWGDSLAAGSSDTQEAAPVKARGFSRAAFGPSRVVACGHMATPGNSTGAYAGTNKRTYDLWKYFTHLVISMGFNDVGVLNGSTSRTQYLNIQTFHRQLIPQIRTNSPGVKVIDLIIPPVITTSTDSFATTANQTIGAEWGMTNGSNPESTQGLGDWFRVWQQNQVVGVAPSQITASINNTQMTITALNNGRLPAVGDTVTDGQGYTGTFQGYNSATAAANGVGVWTITPAVPAGLASRAFTCTPPSGPDFVIGAECSAPGTRDKWAIASSTGYEGLPAGTPIGTPTLNGTVDPANPGANHPWTNQYKVFSKGPIRRAILGIND